MNIQPKHTGVSNPFTCDRVECRDHQHEDGGQVQVPPETHLDKQGSGVEVGLAVGTTHHACRQC